MTHSGTQSTIHLLPRRAEIVNTIRDHHMVTFDFLSRRFPTTRKSTLHFDLTQLARQGHIRKLGATRGALYSLPVSQGDLSRS